jgi:hypothetical protein
MTDPKFERDLEQAMGAAAATTMPKVASLNVTNTLNTEKLLEVARGRYDFARGELNRLNMEFQIERTRLLEETRASIERLEQECKGRLHALELIYIGKMKPAKDMADLVGKLLDERA